MQRLFIQKIYFAIPGDLSQRTGGYGYDRRMIAELETLGCEVQLVSLPAGFPTPSASDWAEAQAQIAALPDGALVLVDGMAYAVMAQLVRLHNERLRFVALCHHPLALETGLDPEWRQRWQHDETAALELASAVVVTSHTTAQILLQDFGVAPENLTVVLPGTQRQAFADCANPEPVLLTVASLIPRKGHDLLIDALAGLTHVPWRGRWVGETGLDPSWAQALEARLQDAGLAGRITLAGPVTDILEEYASADVFVLPSHYEGYGMAFAEALSFGLPIIATAAGAIPDVVPQSAGVLVPPGDLAALTLALNSLLTDPDLRKQYQTGAQQASVALPTWEQSAQILLHSLSALVAK